MFQTRVTYYNWWRKLNNIDNFLLSFNELFKVFAVDLIRSYQTISNLGVHGVARNGELKTFLSGYSSHLKKILPNKQQS